VGELPPSGYPVYSWDRVVELFAVWLGEVKRDQETPDLFAELQQERELLIAATAENVENTPFSADEQESISTQIREIKEYVKKTHQLSKEQARAPETGLDHFQAEARQ